MCPSEISADFAATGEGKKACPFFSAGFPLDHIIITSKLASMQWQAREYDEGTYHPETQDDTQSDTYFDGSQVDQLYNESIPGVNVDSECSNTHRRASMVGSAKTAGYLLFIVNLVHF